MITRPSVWPIKAPRSDRLISRRLSLGCGEDNYVSDQGTSMTDDSDSQKRLRARIGGLSLHLRHDSKKIAATARAGFDARFYREALELDPTLGGHALEKKVRILRSLYFTRLALRSMKTRQKKNHRANGNS